MFPVWIKSCHHFKNFCIKQAWWVEYYLKPSQLFQVVRFILRQLFVLYIRTFSEMINQGTLSRNANPIF